FSVSVDAGPTVPDELCIRVRARIGPSSSPDDEVEVDMSVHSDVTGIQVRRGRRNRPLARRLASVVSAGAALAMLAGCAGSAGDSGGGSDAGGEGFAWDAPQEEVDAAVADHEPVTLTLQAGGPTEDSISGRRTMDFI